MVGNKTLGVSLLAVFLAGVSWPVQGYFQAHSFFSPSNKYRDWFKETPWFGNQVRYRHPQDPEAYST